MDGTAEGHWERGRWGRTTGMLGRNDGNGGGEGWGAMDSGRLFGEEWGQKRRFLETKALELLNETIGIVERFQWNCWTISMGLVGGIGGFGWWDWRFCWGKLGDSGKEEAEGRGGRRDLAGMAWTGKGRGKDVAGLAWRGKRRGKWWGRVKKVWVDGGGMRFFCYLCSGNGGGCREMEKAGRHSGEALCTGPEKRCARGRWEGGWY